ncbi:MAG: ABC transporter substrate-binding protein [Bacillota bacterium]|jgi:NitT/TauT family transport system substrate-binding protein
MKKIVLFIIAFTMLFTITGCSGNDTESADSQTVKIGLLSIDDSLPFFVAEQEGLYEELGVDVELVPFGSALDKETALEAGEIDGDMTDLVVTGLLKKGGLDVKIVSTALGAEPSEGRFVLLAAPNSGISDISQLKGQTIAIGNNTIIQYVGDQICYMNGLTDADIVTDNIPDLALRMETLLSDGVPAAILPDPLATVAIKNGAIPLADDTQLTNENGSPVNLSQSVVIFRQESIDQKADAIKLVMQGYNEAKNMITNDPETYRAALAEFTSIPENLVSSYTMPAYTAHHIPDKAEVEAVFNWMFDKGLLDEQYTYENMVDESFIN